MDILEAIALGILQGVTEWLPISSSGHLALAHHIFGTDVDISFDIILHLGTLIAVLAYYRSDIISIAKGILARDQKSIRLAALIVLAGVPTAIIGLAFKDFFASMFSSLLHVAGALALTGIFLIFVRNRNGTSKPGVKEALAIGAAQGLAVAPGISRSGATIGTALLLGIDRDEAARFSFLAGVLPILGAAILEGRHALDFDIGIIPLLAGFLSAAVVGYLSIGLLIKLLKQSKLHWFGYYCLIVAGMVALLVFL